ncbi:MAG: methyltransferase domain-containing protein [Oscillospiraceae bacterium]|nr:methyltransferase domain-containing protein [Oscillospiraceae bacterium]
MKPVLQCPVCGLPLHADAQGCRCENRHSFDRSRYGYVNLLQKQRKKLRGDDAEMIRARRDFLEGGAYLPLLRCIADAVQSASPRMIADIGCGEGWYSCSLLRELPGETGLAGIDISPAALRYAAKRAEQCGLASRTEWAAASVSRLPFASESCDLLLNLFAPCEAGEFARVLREDGLLVRAIPLERHLWELKQAIYREPYENRPVLSAPAQFTLLDVQRITYRFTVSGQQMQNLFAMTPYAHKTAPEDAKRLPVTETMEVQAAFGVLICRKQPRGNSM